MADLLDKDGEPVIATGHMKERLAAALKHANQIPYPGMERLFTPKEAMRRFLWQSKGWRDLWEERVDHFLAACDAMNLIVEDGERENTAHKRSASQNPVSKKPHQPIR